LNNRIIL